MSQAEVTMGAHSGLMEEPAFSVPAKKMAMWLFIIADSATFAGCLVAYGFIRNATPDWPRPFHGITNVALMTLILLTSSLTMLFGVRHAQRGDKAESFPLDPDYGSLRNHVRRPAHSGMDGNDRRRSDPVPQSLGHAAVQFAVFQHYRPASAARNRRRDRSDRSGDCATRADATMPMTSRLRDCIGTSWIWFGCSWCRWSIF